MINKRIKGLQIKGLKKVVPIDNRYQWGETWSEKYVVGSAKKCDRRNRRKPARWTSQFILAEITTRKFIKASAMTEDEADNRNRSIHNLGHAWVRGETP